MTTRDREPIDVVSDAQRIAYEFGLQQRGQAQSAEYELGFRNGQAHGYEIGFANGEREGFGSKGALISWSNLLVGVGIGLVISAALNWWLR